MRSPGSMACPWMSCGVSRGLVVVGAASCTEEVLGAGGAQLGGRLTLRRASRGAALSARPPPNPGPWKPALPRTQLQPQHPTAHFSFMQPNCGSCSTPVFFKSTLGSYLIAPKKKLKESRSHPSHSVQTRRPIEREKQSERVGLAVGLRRDSARSTPWSNPTCKPLHPKNI